MVFSAVLVGTFAPDFEYFLRLAPDDRFSHTLRGTFILTLPLAFIVLWLFHAFVKEPVIALSPSGLKSSLDAYRTAFQFGGAGRFLLIIISLLVGIATHLAWDSFTHPNTWMYHHWSLLSRPVALSHLGSVPTYKVFQHGSTVFGIGLLALFFVRWYQATAPSRRVSDSKTLSERRVLVISTGVGVAVLGAVVRSLVGAGVPESHLVLKKFIGEFVVTVIALAWWELVLYGIFLSKKFS